MQKSPNQQQKQSVSRLCIISWLKICGWVCAIINTWQCRFVSIIVCVVFCFMTSRHTSAPCLRASYFRFLTHCSPLLHASQTHYSSMFVSYCGHFCAQLYLKLLNSFIFCQFCTLLHIAVVLHVPSWFWHDITLSTRYHLISGVLLNLYTFSRFYLMKEMETVDLLKDYDMYW